ncbi:hypothetical protein [Gimesia maris]|uniref:DAC domain-containing protein n=1 Tax=Gimesia maris TaxID=122 RepID=A0ABX5YRA2_9PLAN|nr:hypothetical protein [Gimesia maris]EDL62171.1 hypothetical protein PM8797T_22968 [Gimesia maris DSM 8797]QEG18294.1 hypothetical protein GmarT_41800 [Gimesia maris]QGQ28720.1 hypothetical protein F1729_08720 [Gimesia maris]
MDETRLRYIVSKYLLPMFPGTELLPDSIELNRRVDLASFKTPNKIILWPGRTADYRLLIQRSQPFSHTDVVFMSHFMGVINGIFDLQNRTFFNQLLEGLIPLSIANYVSGHTDSPVGTCVKIIQQLENWASQTYEGQNISASIGFDPSITDSRGPTLDEIWSVDFSAVLTSSVDTILVVDSDLHISSFEAVTYSEINSIAPYRMLALAQWSIGPKSLFCLNRRGEILVFRNGHLEFAKRSGKWVHYTHDSITKLMGRIGSPELRMSVYETCLDVGFSRTGGCISIVKSSCKHQLNKIVHNDDLLKLRIGPKSHCIDTIVNSPFHEIDRRLRQELAAIDGATIIDHDGNVLAVGAIVKVPSGSRGGARRASAISLARLGIAIKISADGGITAFKSSAENSDDVNIAFEIG